MKPRKKISRIITTWLVVIVIAACAVSAALIYLTLTKRAENQTTALVQQNVEDVSVDIDEWVDSTFANFINNTIKLVNNLCHLRHPNLPSLFL